MSGNSSKSLGAAIDDMINALKSINEKDRVVAINAVCNHLSLSPLALTDAGKSAGKVVETPQQAFQTNIAPAQKNHLDIRSLKEEKKPSSAREMACIVAYYMEYLAPESERKDAVGNDDIDKYFKQAGFRLPQAIGQLLKDAKGAGYFDSVSRGKFKLNPVGYNLVVHGLPRGEGASQKSKK